MKNKAITLFTSPKPFVGHSAIIQSNALDSWSRLPNTKVLLFGNDYGVADAAAERGFIHEPEVTCSSYGTPLLNEIFTKAQAIAESDIICYANADIIFPKNFIEVINLLQKLLPSFMAVGQRWDIDVIERLNFSAEDIFFKLESLRNNKGKLHSQSGKDYFLFPKGQIKNMPPFCIGRPFWDDWMIWNAKQQKIPVVDLTECLIVYHQNHDYEHIPERVSPNWVNSPEALNNRNLITNLENFSSSKLTIYHTDFYLSHGQIIKQRALRRFIYDVRYIYAAPIINRLKRLIKYMNNK